MVTKENLNNNFKREIASETYSLDKDANCIKIGIRDKVISSLALVLLKNRSANLINTMVDGDNFSCDFEFLNGDTFSINEAPYITDQICKLFKLNNLTTSEKSIDNDLLLSRDEFQKKIVESGHESRTSNFDGVIGAENFLITKTSGVYRDGDNNNKMLQRISGVVFCNREEKENYLEKLKDAEKNNHIKLGRELKLFIFDESAPGEAYWLPKGLKLYNQLISFFREIHDENGYQEIATPLISKPILYETSGHMDHYKDNMFISDTTEGEYILKPMNCPNAIVVYKSEGRTYKDFPLRFSDIDKLHRFEKSGEINGLLRGRSFQQDDAHIFLEENQISQEIENIFKITNYFYETFGLEYNFRLGTRGDNYMGSLPTWNNAENILKQILEKQKKEKNKNYLISEGDAAFYGPKIDILMKDSLNRNWQMGTIQLDFQLPERFNLKYTDRNGGKTVPVLIHRVVYGSFERFIGIITEHFKGNFPAWLSPDQVAMVPVSDKNIGYVEMLSKKIKSAGIRYKLYDEYSDRIGKRIYQAKKENIPYVLVVGDKEEKNREVAVNYRQTEEGAKTTPVMMNVDSFIEGLSSEIKNRSLISFLITR